MTLTLTNQEKKWGWLYLLLQMLLVPFAAAFLCVWLGIRSDTVVNLLCFFVNAALAVLFFRRLLERSFERCRGRWPETVRTAMGGFGLYWLIQIAANSVILSVDPEFGNVNDANVGVMLAESPLLMHIAVIFAAPLAEECLFRGWIFTGLARRSIPLAYAVTCCFFSAVHVVGYIGSYDALTLALCFLQYLGPGVALCWTCQKNDSLCAPLLLHMTINTMACIFVR